MRTPHTNQPNSPNKVMRPEPQETQTWDLGALVLGWGVGPPPLVGVGVWVSWGFRPPPFVWPLGWAWVLSLWLGSECGGCE
eukprot:2504986-Prorocentrum_lima.AAC.1